MNLVDLLNAINRASSVKGFPISNKESGIRYVAESFASFVQPSFRSDIGDINESQVVIISAPGAVGKSTLAKELAFICHAPLWDLAFEQPIAGHSLMGALTEAFDDDALEARQGLRSGEAVLIIDALDEARVKTNEAAFEAFISDVAKLAKDSRGTSFVLLGRTQVAEFTWMLLDDKGVSTALVEIEPFDPERAKEYIDKRARAREDNAWDRIQEHRGPFEEARDAVFGLLTETIDGNRAQQGPTGQAYGFLGYAPVLDAITELFSGESNFHELKRRITQDDGKAASEVNRTPLMLLRRIVEEILDREHRQKLGLNIRPALANLAAAVGWNAWDTLYTPVEQVDRLLALVTKSEYQYPSPVLPPRLQGEYEGHLAPWLPEHPFLRDGATLANVVFESYVLARSLVAGTTTTRNRAEQFMARPEYKPAGLVAEFYFLFAGEMGEREVPADHIGILYDSTVASETEARRLRFSLEGPEAFDEADGPSIVEGELEFLTWQDDTSAEVTASWSFTSTLTNASRICFRQSLREATVIVPCQVQLGTDGTEFRLGPNVTVRAAQLEFCCKTLVVEAKPKRRVGDDGSVTLEAEECGSATLDRPVVRGDLRVAWPGAEKYPWTEFGVSPAGSRYTSPMLREAFRRFRRIAQTLRSHSKGSLARYKDKVEHQRVLQGELGQKLLERLVDDGILVLQGAFYHWVPDRAGDLVGISWMDLRRWSTSEKLTNYLESFLRDNSGLAKL